MTGNPTGQCKRKLDMHKIKTSSTCESLDAKINKNLS